jgi:hypothetical protein
MKDKYWGNWYEPGPSKKGKEKKINLMILLQHHLIQGKTLQMLRFIFFLVYCFVKNAITLIICFVFLIKGTNFQNTPSLGCSQHMYGGFP